MSSMRSPNPLLKAMISAGEGQVQSVSPEQSVEACGSEAG